MFLLLLVGAIIISYYVISFIIVYVIPAIVQFVSWVALGIYDFVVYQANKFRERRLRRRTQQLNRDLLLASESSNEEVQTPITSSHVGRGEPVNIKTALPLAAEKPAAGAVLDTLSLDEVRMVDFAVKLIAFANRIKQPSEFTSFLEQYSYQSFGHLSNRYTIEEYLILGDLATISNNFSPDRHPKLYEPVLMYACVLLSMKETTPYALEDFFNNHWGKQALLNDVDALLKHPNVTSDTYYFNGSLFYLFDLETQNEYDLYSSYKSVLKDFYQCPGGSKARNLLFSYLLESPAEEDYREKINSPIFRSDSIVGLNRGY